MRVWNFLKILLIVFVLASAILAFFVYRYRCRIFQVSAEAIIRNNLPSYVAMEKIVFEFDKDLVRIEGLGIKAPAGYQNKYLVYVDEVICPFSMRGENILDGIEIAEIEATGVTINIERQREGRMNVGEMGAVMGQVKPRKSGMKIPAFITRLIGGMPKINIAQLVKLTDTVKINNGRVSFTDRAVSRRPLTFTLEDVRTDVVLRLNDDYTGVVTVGSTGDGLVDDDPAQKIFWNMSMDPRTKELTMSTRINVENLDVTRFLPYYDKFCPVAVESGNCTGTFVFDFDNGNIGSDNEIVLKNFKFSRKTDVFAASFWEASVEDVITYLETAPGEVTFDFKIKGTMRDPRFMPGPIVKAAMRRMAIDTIAAIVRKDDEGEERPEPKTNVEKVIYTVKDIIKVLQDDD